MSLSRRIFEDEVKSSECEIGCSAVGLSRSEETAVEAALFLLKKVISWTLRILLNVQNQQKKKIHSIGFAQYVS